MKRLGIPQRLALFLLVCSAPLGQAAERLGTFIGADVTTLEGQRVGEIVDAAVNPDTYRIDFYVIAIGSFLVEDSLIAVHPDALSVTTAGSSKNEPTNIRLTASASSLAKAQRFNNDSWPQQADVFADSEFVGTAEQGAQAGSTGIVADPGSTLNGLQNQAGNRIRGSVRNQGGFNATGSATISDGRRLATLAEGKREIAQVEPIGGSASGNEPQVPVPLPSYERLDRNGDGRLSRREIGPQLEGDQGYSDLDLDDSGGIDEFEFDVFKSSRKSGI